MNWQIVSTCMQDISALKPNTQQAIVTLRHEVVASTQLTDTEKTELHELLDGLQQANMYGRISFVAKLKEVFSAHSEFKSKFPEFRMERD